MKTKALFLALMLGCGAAMADYETDFAKKYAPYLSSQDTAFAKVREVIASLPAKERAAVAGRVAFALRSPVQRQHCTSTFELAGTELVRGRQDGLLLLFMCRRNLINTANALATVFLMSMTAKSVEDNEVLGGQVIKAMESAADLAASDYDLARNGSDAGTSCHPAYRAYVFLHGLRIQDCFGLTDPAVVRNAMWPRIRKMAEANMDFQDRNDPKNYWAVGDEITTFLADLVFKFVVLHEIGHVVHGDLSHDSYTAGMETKADIFARKIIVGDRSDAMAGMAYLNFLIVGYLGGSVEAFNGKMLPLKDLQTRVNDHLKAHVCALKNLKHGLGDDVLARSMKDMFSRKPALTNVSCP